MANDYSLDPLEIEEQQLRERQLRAQAAGLRLTGNPIIDAGLATGDRVKSLFDQKFIDDDRKALGAKADAQMEKSLEGVDPHIANLLRNPRTRTTGEALLLETSKRKLDRDEDERAGVGGGAQPTYAEAVRMSTSNVPRTAARGKQWLAILEPRDPTKSGRSNPVTGDFEPDAAAEAAMVRRAAGKVAGEDDIIKIPTGTGTWEGARSAVPPELRHLVPALRQAPAPAGAPPATLPPTLPPNAPIQAPSPVRQDSTGGGGALPSATDAIGKVASLPPNPSSGGDVRNWKVQPGEQATRDGGAVQILMGEYQSELQKFQSAPSPEAKQMAAQNLAALTQELKRHKVDPTQGPQTQSVLSSATAAANGTTAPRPNPGPGVADPVGADIHKEGVKTSEGIYKAGQEKATVPGGSTLDALNTAAEAIENPSFFGTGGTALGSASQAIGSFFGIPSSKKAVNTDRLEGLYKNLSVATLRDYGSSQSLTDMDLRENAKRYPDVLKDPVLQKELIDRHRDIIMISHQLDQQVSREMQQARTTGAPIDPVQRKNELYMEYTQNKWRDKGNPTQAGGAEALPGATQATNQLPSKMPGARPPGYQEPETSVFKFLGDEPMKDFGRNVVPALKGTLNAQAAWDSGQNMGYGVRQAFGQDNYAEWAKVKDEQDKRRASDPDYDRGRHFYDIFKPTNMIPGGGSIAGTALTSGLQSFLEPTTEPGTKIENTLRGTVLGGVAGTVSKAVPSTKLAPGLNAESSGDKLLAQFPQATKQLTGTQVKQSGKIDATIGNMAGIPEAAYLNQAKAITSDIMTNAGIPGKILTVENIAKGEANLSADFGKWANKLGKSPMDSTEGQALSGVLKSVANEGTPTLNTIIEPLATGKIRAMSVDTLQKAWNEVGQSGAPKATQDAVRAAIEKQMGKAGDLKGFYALAERSRAIQDVKRVWKSGGQEGHAEAAGYLSPAKIVEEAERGPWNAGHMEAAARFVNRFRVRNYKELGPETSLTGALTRGGQVVAGHVLNAGDFTGHMLSKGPKTKFITEMLRAGTARAPEQWMHPDE